MKIVLKKCVLREWRQEDKESLIKNADNIKVARMANIGTLFALAVVSLGVIILRRTKPQLERPFKVPWVPYLPAIAVIACLYLMFNLPLVTWLRLIIWGAIGVGVYFLYGYNHSRLRSFGDHRTKRTKPFRFRPDRV